jgi:hypothetical protein
VRRAYSSSVAGEAEGEAVEGAEDRMKITVLRERAYETDIDATVDVESVRRDEDMPSVTVYGVRDRDGSRLYVVLDDETIAAIVKAKK